MMVQNTIEQDVAAFFSRENELFFSEKDFQLHLALYLMQSKNYDKVEIEYFIPKQELADKVWNNNVKIDIVVRSGDEYVPIELKYCTKRLKLNEITITRFGEDLKDEELKDVEIVKNQGAEDIRSYDFWKDVHRLELVLEHFPAAKVGYAIFVTNNGAYKNKKTGVACEEFSMHRGMHATSKRWHKNPKVAENHPDFDLLEEREIKWNDIKLEGIKFYYCIVKVEL